jgi:hypothetical protein
MRHFLWKLAGGDVHILMKSDEQSQNTFKFVGILFLINLVYTFVSTTALFTGIFDGFLVGVLVSIILSFLIGVIYLLNILDLEPRTLPRIELDRKSFYFTYFIRFFSLFLLSLFVVKSMEIFLFKHLFILNFSPQRIIQEIKKLNTVHPEVWIFTVLSIILFFLPIIVKYQLSNKILEKEKNYYELKKKNDIKLVVFEYERFLKQKQIIYSRLYDKYNILNELFSSIKTDNNKLTTPAHQYRKRKYKSPLPKYTDPPFNTIKISDLKNQVSSSHEDYLNTLTDNGNLAEGN